MKLRIVYILVFQLLISSQIYSQDKTTLVGRTFSRKISETCKDGIGTLMIYESLRFEKDYVIISFQVKEYVIPSYVGFYENMYADQTKKYKYTLHKNQVKFKNHETFDVFILANSIIKSLDSQIQFFEEASTKDLNLIDRANQDFSDN